MHITLAFTVSAAGLLLMGATASSAPALAFVALLASTASMATDTLNVREGGHPLMWPALALHLHPADCSMTCAVCSFCLLSFYRQLAEAA